MAQASAEKLEHTGHAEKERVASAPQRKQLARTPEPPLPKGKGRRKDLYRTERDSLEGPHDEAEIQRKALRRGKNLAFSEDTCLEKERVRSKVTPRKVGVGLKRSQEPSRNRMGWRLAW